MNHVIIGYPIENAKKSPKKRNGTSEGPLAITQALAHLSYPTDLIDCKSQVALTESVTSFIKKGQTPIVIGGSRDVVLGAFQGIAQSGSLKEFTLVNFSPSLDLSPEEPFGKMVEQARKLQIPFRYVCLGAQTSINPEIHFEETEAFHVEVILADDFHHGGAEISFDLLEELITQSENIYVSIDMNVFAAPFAPGASALQVLGLLPWHVIPSLQVLAESGKLIGLDLSEFCPAFDRDGLTAQLAASLIALVLKTRQLIIK
jgi:formiminoglutamase